MIVRNAQNKSPLVDVCICISMFSTLLILYGTPARKEAIVSFGTRVMLGIVLVGIILICIQILYKESLLRRYLYFFTMVLLSFLIGVFSTSFSQTILRYANYTCFFMLPLLLIIIPSITYKNAVRNIVFFYNWAAFFIYVYYYFSPYSHIMQGLYGEYYSDDLTLGFSNPNLTAMMLLVSLFIFIIDFFDKRQKKKPALIILFPAAVIFYFIWKTDCRAGIIVALFFVFFAMLTDLKFVLNRKIIFAIFSVPILYIFFSLLSQINVMGASISTGRNEMYKLILNSTTFKSFLFGNYTDYAFNNSHNGYITVFATFGILVTILFIACYYNCYNFYADYLKKINSKSRRVAFLGLLCIIVHSSVEASFLTTGTFCASSVGLLAVLCLDEYESEII